MKTLSLKMGHIDNWPVGIAVFEGHTKVELRGGAGLLGEYSQEMTSSQYTYLWCNFSSFIICDRGRIFQSCILYSVMFS